MPIYVSSLHNIGSSIERCSPEYIISILDPEYERPVFNNAKSVLNMSFHDICFEPNYNHDKSEYIFPNRNHVDEILHFGAFHYKKDSVLMTHCFAGISRSSAAAIIALCPHHGYQEAVKMVADIDMILSKDGLAEKGSAWFMPNNLMIKYADERLALDGAMINLVNETFAF
jgi:predicted protein tyrosine phosphatase